MLEPVATSDLGLGGAYARQPPSRPLENGRSETKPSWVPQGRWSRDRGSGLPGRWARLGFTWRSGAEEGEVE